MTILTHSGTGSVVFGLVWADGIEPGVVPPAFETLLARALDARRRPLTPEEEAIRLAGRDMLRNGTYKPTGRAKPASEYLLRAASKGDFPRINPLVDICNFMSLTTLLPSSLWDRDRAEDAGPAGADYAARLGAEGESYVFNASGQVIQLRDLVLIACAGRPVVNPVKDSQATKTSQDTRRVGAVVYFPSMIDVDAEAVCREYGDLLGACGPGARAEWSVVRGTP